MSRNVEVKIRIDQIEALRTRVRDLGAADEGTILQVDTYFATPPGGGGRLKLREQDPGRSELIAYRRPDTAGLRVSDYRIVPLAEPSGLREALTTALGVARQVTKTRHLLWYGRTRIHLDQVEGLGDFLELEVVLADGENTATGAGEAERILTELSLAGARRLPGSYADL